MITIVSDPQAAPCGAAIHEQLLELGQEATHLTIAEEELKPCFGCGGCETKSFRRCVFRDGADRMLPHIAQSETLVVVTPLTYGGYSYQAKLVVDKLALIGDLYYYVKDKELVKGLGPGKYFVIGVSEGCSELEAKAFEFLVRETCIITGWQGKAIITPKACDAEKLAREIS